MFGLTKEADGALRIVWLLGQRSDCLSAAEISEQIAVPAQFTLKILRKLSEGGVVRATRGKYGGYALEVPPEVLSVRRVVELIDGPITLNRCQENDFLCSRMGKNKEDCRFHCLFCALGEELTARLERVTIRDMIAPQES